MAFRRKRESRSTFSCFMPQKPEKNIGLMDHLACMQTYLTSWNRLILFPADLNDWRRPSTGNIKKKTLWKQLSVTINILRWFLINLQHNMNFVDWGFYLTSRESPLYTNIRDLLSSQVVL